VQRDGRKLEFGASRRFWVERPNRFRVEAEDREGQATLVVFDGRALSAADLGRNVHAQAVFPTDRTIDDAGGGSFRGGQDYSRGGSRQARSGGGGRMAARQPGAGGGFGGQPSRGVAARQEAASERGAQRDAAREDWQTYGKNRQEDRQDFWEDEVDDIDGVWAGSWDNVRVYDADDFWTGVAVVGVGSALTAAAFDAMRADSGCTMTQVKANGAEYYYCAPNWYVRTMNGGTYLDLHGRAAPAWPSMARRAAASHARRGAVVGRSPSRGLGRSAGPLLDGACVAAGSRCHRRHRAAAVLQEHRSA